MLWGLALLLLCEVSLQPSANAVKVCGRPPLIENAEMEDDRRVFEAGEETFYTCKPGYKTTGGSRKVVCTLSGAWSRPTLKCSRKSCPVPGPLLNGQIQFPVDISFQSVVNFTCHEGYVLQGAHTSQCQHDGTWSQPLPVCETVTCGLPDIPQYGLIHHTKKITGNTTQFGDVVKYECSPPYALFGNEFGSCQANGNWTKPPECKIVTCPFPSGIPNGFMTFAVVRDYGYREKIKYGCNPSFIPDGPLEIQCEKTGNWSAKPVCRASCIIDIRRGRIFYSSKKIWIEDLPEKRVQHSEHVAFYCKNEEKKCGYPVVTQCVDGTLNIPECFKEPGAVEYKLNYKSLPSEIKMC
nr:PREDICTED: beta-2-glycoprotein 1 [Lepisosteus oculatus]